ncbi:uncharacterized protein DSM5745_10219 [Aspergillus mulundensis]|uniref:Uncharacterized protein n=1 Tax=Aspergillus mulundensis TaxID=1810919 RepID=A0A3D8QN51_9EURO|nr:Uncharacterized protein DSM5745_10219 [Aspergillus mulundensis]RDW63108.1 Uncharacterized protein DSM5745_10219 [Aspergillus mulundensis]
MDPIFLHSVQLGGSLIRSIFFSWQGGTQEQSHHRVIQRIFPFCLSQSADNNQMMEQKPQRVLVIVSGSNSYWEQSWSSSEDLLPIAFGILKDNHLLEGTYTDQDPPELKLLVKQKWATHVFLVFDISNTSYDPTLGHMPEQNKLPITIIRLSKKIQAYSASAPIGNKVNSDVARVHNASGINSLPPFVTDYTIESPLYPNPRDPLLLV